MSRETKELRFARDTLRMAEFWLRFYQQSVEKWRAEVAKLEGGTQLALNVEIVP